MTAAPVQPPLSAIGRYIVDADGRRVRLAGVNWYGAHEDDGVVSGLERTGRVRLARAIARLGLLLFLAPWHVRIPSTRPDDRPTRLRAPAVTHLSTAWKTVRADSDAVGLVSAQGAPAGVAVSGRSIVASIALRTSPAMSSCTISLSSVGRS